MAQESLYTHPKFLELAARLGNRALATGVLHLIWRVAYNRADPVVGSPEAVALAADWQAEPQDLVTLLVDTGFLEWTEGSGGKRVLQVHGFWKHAPDYVKKRRRRREAKDALPSEVDPPTADDVRPMSGPCPTNGGQCPPNGGNTVTHTYSNTPPVYPTGTLPPPTGEAGQCPVKPNPKRTDYAKWASVWNAVAEATGLPKVRDPAKWPQARKQALRLRLRELGETDLKRLLEAPLTSAFLRGETGRESWRGVTLDWLLKPTNSAKVLEGAYEDKPKRKNGTNHTRSPADGQLNLDPAYVEAYQTHREHPLFDAYVDACDARYGPGGERGAWPRFEDWLQDQPGNQGGEEPP